MRRVRLTTAPETSAHDLERVVIIELVRRRHNRHRYFNFKFLPESGPGRAPTNIIERVSVCLSTGFVPVVIKVSGVMAWRFGRLTGVTMQSLGVAIRWQITRYAHAKSWHGAVMHMAQCCHGMVTCWYPGQPSSFQG